MFGWPKLASDSGKAKSNYNFVKDFFSLKSMTKAHLCNLCNGERNCLKK